MLIRLLIFLNDGERDFNMKGKLAKLINESMHKLINLEKQKFAISLFFGIDKQMNK